MDFTTTEASDDLSGLVGTIVDAVCTPDHQRELDGLPERFDTELWRKLIETARKLQHPPEKVGAGLVQAPGLQLKPWPDRPLPRSNPPILPRK